MRILFTIVIMITAGTCLKAQVRESYKGGLPPDPVMKKQARYLVSNYKVAMITSVNCRNKEFDVNSILKKFTNDAIIEVSNVRNDRIVPRKARDYFNNLHLLCLGINYDSIDITFPPEFIRDEEITKTEYTCIIKRQIKQSFKGFKKGNPVPVYCDITIKRIEIIFELLDDGSYRGLIKRVAVEDTNPCSLNTSM